MKSKLPFLLPALFVVLHFSSCNHLKETRQSFAETVDSPQVGVVHNGCLNVILQTFKDSPKTKSGDISLSRAELDELVTTTTLTYVTTTYEITEDSEISLVKRVINDQLALTRESIIGIVTDSSIEEQDVYEELDAIMTDGDLILTSLNSRIDNCTERAKLLLSGTKLEEFLASASVAKNTLQYWHNNHMDWVSTLNTPITRASSVNWKQLGKADVIGCVASVTGSGVSWLLGCGPVGWKAWLAVAASGAIVGSVEDALDQLM